MVFNDASSISENEENSQVFLYFNEDNLTIINSSSQTSQKESCSWSATPTMANDRASQNTRSEVGRTKEWQELISIPNESIQYFAEALRMLELLQSMCDLHLGRIFTVKL